MNTFTKVANIPRRQIISRNQQNNNMNFVVVQSRCHSVSVKNAEVYQALFYEHTVSLVG